MTQKLISIGEILKRGWKLYSENINVFIYPIIILILPYVGMFLVGYFEIQPMVILNIVLSAIAVIINLWLAILFIELINNIYTKKQVSAENLYEVAFRKIPSYFVVAVLVGIITIIGASLVNSKGPKKAGTIVIIGSVIGGLNWLSLIGWILLSGALNKTSSSTYVPPPSNQIQPIVSQKKFCRNCGSPIHEGMNFCQSCGESL